MVLGRLPFVADNPADAIQMHLAASPPQPQHLVAATFRRAIEELLLGLLAKVPEARPSRRLRADLQQLRCSIPTAPMLDRVTQAPAPRPLRRRRHLVRLGLVAATFVGLVIFGYRPQHPRPANANEPQHCRGAGPS